MLSIQPLCVYLYIWSVDHNCGMTVSSEWCYATKKTPAFSPLVSFQQAWWCMVYTLAGLFPLQQLHSPSLSPIKGSVGALWERHWRDRPWEIPGRWFHRRTLDEKLQNFWWVTGFQHTTVARAPSGPREPAPTDKHIKWSVKKKCMGVLFGFFFN